MGEEVEENVKIRFHGLILLKEHWLKTDENLKNIDSNEIKYLLEKSEAW